MRFFDMSRKSATHDLAEAPLGGTREQAMQRLQIGLAGVVLMVLLVGLASIIQNRAAQTDAMAVPEAAPTTEPSEEPAQTDPLVEAGVVPDLPEPPEPAPSASPRNGAPANTSSAQ